MSDSPTSTPPQTEKPYNVYTREYEIIFTVLYSHSSPAPDYIVEARVVLNTWGGRDKWGELESKVALQRRITELLEPFGCKYRMTVVLDYWDPNTIRGINYYPNAQYEPLGDNA